jgi:hypothetical protein
LGSFLVRLIVAVLVMSAALLGMMYVMPEWSLGTMPYRLMRLMAVVVRRGGGLLCHARGAGFQSERVCPPYGINAKREFTLWCSPLHDLSLMRQIEIFFTPAIRAVAV